MRPHSRGSLSQKAYLEIRERILRGVLPLGSSLSRRGLAEALGMSVLPVAKALQQLERDGLVESRPRVGTPVKVPTPQDVRGHYIVREALESQAARLCAEKASPGERRELVKMAGALDDLFSKCANATAEDGRLADLLFSAHKLHMSFHLRVAECAGSPVLFEMIERNQVLIFNWLYDEASHHSRKLPRAWHRDLAVTVVGHDPVAADAAMRRHVTYGMEEVLGELQRFTLGDWFLNGGRAADGRVGRSEKAPPLQPASKEVRSSRS